MSSLDGLSLLPSNRAKSTKGSKKRSDVYLLTSKYELGGENFGAIGSWA